MASSKSSNYRWLIALGAIGVVFLFLLWKFDFIQDDAFITFRYALNFDNGHGLVWNIGERVEGYTNFFWVILLIFFKNLGLDYVFTAKVLSILLGLGTLYLTYQFSRELMRDRANAVTIEIVGLCSTALVAFNYCFIYWTVAGLETPLFVFLALAALYTYHKRSWLLLPVLTVLVLTRPEGALVSGFIILYGAIEKRGIPKDELKIVGAAFLLTIPYLVFKQYYFGGILPNPFYAKTGWDTEQLRAGMDYLWTFLSGYTLYGVMFVVPVAVYKRLPDGARLLYWFALLYTVYVTVVGGDVLKVGRFFTPMLAPLFVCFLISVTLLLKRREVTIDVALVVIASALYLPYDHVNAYLEQERGFYRANGKMIEPLMRVDTTNFSLATPTIGRVGYMLIGHDVYDMVGLTDSTVARHPQSHVPGMVTTWRERKFNAEYILSRNPDYILFSTSIKPSAPGERALFMYPAFVKNYKPVGFYFGQRMNDVFKRVSDTLGEIKREYSVDFVQNYVAGVNDYFANRYQSALSNFTRAARSGPEEGFGYIYYFIAKILSERNDSEGASKAFDRALEIDSTIYPVHLDLYFIYERAGYHERAKLHRDYLLKLVPWAVPSMDSLVRASM